MTGATILRRGSWRVWLLAARLPTLTVSVSAVLVGTGAAIGGAAAQALPALAALVVAVAIQVGTNYHNDASDYLHGADTKERRGPTRATAAGLLPASRVLGGAYICFGIAALAGLYLALLHGWLILLVGVLSIAAGIAYTATPFRLGYRGLGDLFVFIFFGVVAVVGTDYVQTGAIRTAAVLASVPVGLLATAVLVVNNLRDLDTDRAAGKRTLAVRLGPGMTRAQYGICLIAALMMPGIMRLDEMVGSWFWAPWLTVPQAAYLIAVVATRSDGPALIRALKGTAQLLLLFSLLFALALGHGPA
ncbi:MAG TPA: 1,4-dihydroxy-2-naphthoate polyprenyltransferase [Candidatus Methylomirabilis sp.]